MPYAEFADRWASYSEAQRMVWASAFVVAMRDTMGSGDSSDRAGAAARWACMVAAWVPGAIE